MDEKICILAGQSDVRYDIIIFIRDTMREIQRITVTGHRIDPRHAATVLPHHGWEIPRAGTWAFFGGERVAHFTLVPGIGWATSVQPRQGICTENGVPAYLAGVLREGSPDHTEHPIAPEPDPAAFTPQQLHPGHPDLDGIR